jgi:2-iminobutanoate/2-iminopropanoate deaminase
MRIWKITATICVAALMLVSACRHHRHRSLDMEFIPVPGAESSNLPFSAAVLAGHTLYLSGNLGNVPGTMDLVAGGIQAETRQTMENIKATVESAGSSMDRVVKCSVFMADISEWGAMNEVYRTYFKAQKAPPARSAFGANGLALGARVEIDCIAVLD